jgi:hypothetical protein
MLGVLGEGLQSDPRHVPCFVTGVAVRDEPKDEMLAIITSALLAYEVDKRTLDSGMTQLVVRPSAS